VAVSAHVTVAVSHEDWLNLFVTIPEIESNRLQIIGLKYQCWCSSNVKYLYWISGPLPSSSIIGCKYCVLASVIGSKENIKKDRIPMLEFDRNEVS